MRSALVMLRARLYLVNSPIVVSSNRSAPTAILLVSITSEKFMMGLAVNSILVIKLAIS
ncbi:hypothetical protein MA16_Dca023205 [Dendrobium catenatum]|uniref:Uncharacterized protein n=1 Tax=Dendrobium catenatum TaxID=906689 RepID=A0A2I0VQA7_9ASPA|nr:hypothetical protein MA16_Dca023205 [Dendrobium catenatum]